MIFICHSVNEAYHIYLFAYVKTILHPKDKPHLIMVAILSMCG
jgi:hypothetical protein